MAAMAAAMRLVLADTVSLRALVACAGSSRELREVAVAAGLARLRRYSAAAAADDGAADGAVVEDGDVLFVLSVLEGGTPCDLVPPEGALRLLRDAAAVSSWGQLGELALPGRAVLAVSVGAEHCLCTTTSGRLFSCGSGHHGRLGYRPSAPRDESSTRLWQATLREVKLEADCGRRVFVVKAEAGGRHSVALDSRGRAWSWGYGRRGRLGHGDGRTRYAPTPISFGDSEPVKLVDVSAGGQHTLLVAESGDAYACGVGGDGRLGLGSGARQFRPTHVVSLALASVRVVACAAGGGLAEGRSQHERGGHSLFLAADGSVWACGCVGNGRLGLRTRVNSRKGYGAFSRTCYSWSSSWSSVNQLLPAKMAAWGLEAQAPAPKVRRVVAGERCSLLLCEDGSLLSFGMSLRGQKTADPHAVANFCEVFDGVDRVEGLDDLHGVPPHCLVPYGGEPEQPHAEAPLDGAARVGAVFAAAGSLYAWGEGAMARKAEDAGGAAWSAV